MCSAVCFVPWTIVGCQLYVVIGWIVWLNTYCTSDTKTTTKNWLEQSSVQLGSLVGCLAMLLFGCWSKRPTSNSFVIIIRFLAKKLLSPKCKFLTASFFFFFLFFYSFAWIRLSCWRWHSNIDFFMHMIDYPYIHIQIYVYYYMYYCWTTSSNDEMLIVVISYRTRHHHSKSLTKYALFSYLRYSSIQWLFEAALRLDVFGYSVLTLKQINRHMYILIWSLFCTR